MSRPFNLFAALLDLAVEDERVELIFKNASTGKDFTRSLGLDGAAQRSARNDALVRASDFLVIGPCDPFVRAQKLSEAVVRFRQHLWPRLKRGTRLQLLPHELWLKRAFLADKDVPTNAEYLYKTLFK